MRVLIQALVRMRALQDRCIANEWMIRRYRKCQEIKNKERDQYKETVRILNEELMTTTAKLKEESRLREEAEKAKVDLVTELTTLRRQVDKVKADAVVEFRVSQPFLNACGDYYGVGFNNCLKQVEFVYPDQDLSQIAIDDTVSLTPWGDETVSKESNDSVHIDLKDNGVVTTQPILEGHVAPVVSSVMDSFIEGGQNVMNLTATNAPLS